jgi:hypothetical protein
MSSTTSYRLSGVALLIGGILTAVGYSLPPYLSDHDPSALTSPWVLISSLITLFGALIVLLGLPGIYTRQAGRAGILGLLGFLSIWYITLLSGVIQSFISVTIVPELAANPATRLLAATPPPAFGPFFLVALLAQTLGILLLAIATLRARVFPRWIARLLRGLSRHVKYRLYAGLGHDGGAHLLAQVRRTPGTLLRLLPGEFWNHLGE